MYHTTGFSRDGIVELTELVEHFCLESDEFVGCPASLGLFTSICVALTYLRRNRTQCELAEAYETSQSTISRAISTTTPWLERALAEWVPVADELAPVELFLVDV